MTGHRADRTPAVAAERVGSAVALSAMLLTPFGRRGGALRRVLTFVTVVAGAARTTAVDARRLGVGRTSAIAATTVATAWVAEVAGVRTGRLFGRYAYTGALRPQLFGVPVVVPLAWLAMAAPAHATAGRLVGGRRGRAAGGAFALTAWDLFLDPQMVGEGYWRWPDGGRYRGVPWSNFVGWLAVAGAVMAIRETLDDHDAAGEFAHVATYGVVAAMETAAFLTFLRDRGVAAAGGVAMLLPLIAAMVRSR